nr:putative uncharacterized protein DDB_G0271606 [Misgurnus anguillicaudatus]
MDSENNKKGSRGIYIPLSEFTNLSLITNHNDTNIKQKNTRPKEEKRLVLIDGEPTFQNQDNDQNLSGKTSQVVQYDNETNNAALLFEILNKETIKGPAVQSTYRLDHKWCQKARDDTSLLSNIASQHEDLNQEKLKDLEELCRLYVQDKDYSKAYIYTGPLYHTKKDITKKEKKKIEERSKNGKALPTYFFKIIILEKNNGERKLKCYEIPNEGKGQGQEKQQEIQHQKQQETQQQQNQQEKQQKQQQKQQQKLQEKQHQKQQEKHQKQHQKQQEKQHQNQQETQQQQQKQQQKLQQKLQQKQEKQQQKLQQKLQQKQEKQQQKLQQKQEKQREKQQQKQLKQQQKLQQKQEKQQQKLQQEHQKQQEKLQEKQEKEQQKLQQKLQQKQEKQQLKLQQKQEKEQEKQQEKLQQKQEKEQQKQQEKLQQKQEKEQEKEHEKQQKQQEKLQQKQQEKPQHQKKVTIKDIENELSKFSKDIDYIEEVSGLTFTEKNQEILRKREEVMAVNFRVDKDITSNPTHGIVETVKIIPKQNTFQREN